MQEGTFRRKKKKKKKKKEEACSQLDVAWSLWLPLKEKEPDGTDKEEAGWMLMFSFPFPLITHRSSVGDLFLIFSSGIPYFFSSFFPSPFVVSSPAVNCHQLPTVTSSIDMQRHSRKGDV